MAEKRSALIVAVSEYQDAGLRRLVAPPQDAEALARVLGDMAIGGFAVKTLLNQPAHQVNREIEAFFANRAKDDLLLLYFSGHGLKDEEGRLYFATTDTDRKFLRTTAVAATLINDVMHTCRSRRQVLILDCCYSGAFARGMTHRADETVGTGEYFKEGRGQFVLTASDALQYAFEGEGVSGTGVRSVFTHTLVRGLETGEADLDGDGAISCDELYDYLHRYVTDRMPQQKPRKWAFAVEGDIIIARNPRPVVKPVALPAELRESIENPLPWMREGAARHLGDLLQQSNKGLAAAARAALQQMAKDDSLKIQTVVAEILKTLADNEKEAAHKTEKVQHQAAEAYKVDEARKAEKIQLQAEETRKAEATHKIKETWHREERPAGLRRLVKRMPLDEVILLVILLLAILGGTSLYYSKIKTERAAAALQKAAEKTQTLQQQTAHALKMPVEFRDTLKDRSQGPIMVVIPGGAFQMGSPDGEPGRSADEGPQHPIRIRHFAIDKTEVTFADYDAFAAATGREKPGDSGWDRGQRPVINVSWNDATAYAAWLSEQTGRHYRLPTEAEWEYAARAGTATPFWTGDCIDTDRANYNGNGDYNNCGAKTGIYRGQTVETGSLPANAWGLHETAGNAWEWVRDCYHDNYRGAPADGNAWEEPNCARRVIRGGGWGNFPEVVRSAYRLGGMPVDANFGLGFRLARDL